PMKSSFLFSKDISAVRIAAIEWHAEPLFAGTIMHELGHALYFKAQKKSSIAKPGTRAYVDEEVDMHLMEMDVLDAATDHKFLQYIDSIVDRTGKVDDFDSLVGSITSDDMQALSDLLGCNGQCSGEEANILFACIVTSLGFRYAQVYADDPREEMIKFYNYCTRELSHL
ncbi:MAG: hypothetical protein GWN62_36105, partial [Aliifodinibius sp.]|nr:hypothetical protein [Fodinibius sp.]